MTLTCTGFAFIVASLTCTAPDPVPDAARFCRTASLIRYSAKDTPETRRQLRIANARYRAVCGDR